MTGIQVLDRRDVERLLKHLVHAEHRDDVKVDVKFYVQFSIDDAYSAQTLVEPWQPFPRSAARQLVQKAIETLDAEEAKHVASAKAQAIIEGAAKSDTPTATTETGPADESLYTPAEVIDYDENPGVIL